MTILLLNVAQTFVVHISAYAIIYDVRILQLLHILALGLHFFMFCGILQLFFCCIGNLSNKQV